MSQPHASAELLTATHGFYYNAALNKNGTVSVTFTLPATERQAVVDLANNDGMELNISVWHTEGATIEDVLGGLGDLDGGDGEAP